MENKADNRSEEHWSRSSYSRISRFPLEFRFSVDSVYSVEILNSSGSCRRQRGEAVEVHVAA